MRRSAAVIALVALAATAGGGSAQGDQGSFVSPLARDIDASASASALGDVPPETDAWSNAGAYWESGGDTPRHGAEDRTDVSSSDVYDAVKALGAVPYRQCFVVVKDGAIAHESYDERRGVDASTRLATDSVGIIATVALVGAATQRGLFRLDQPVMSYGVQGMQDKFGAYAGLVTPRHLLAQTHGGGEVPPGQTFRRDDDPPEYNHYYMLPFAGMGGFYALSTMAGWNAATITPTIALASGIAATTLADMMSRSFL